MKNTLLLAGCLFLTFHSHMLHAQYSYHFLHKTEAYTSLAPGTGMLLSPTDIIPVGFDVTIDGITNDTIYVTKDGTISASGFDSTCPKFYAFGAEHSMGQYTYRTDMIGDKRVLKMQFQNVKFDHDFIGVDFCNVQVWLYEEDKALEVHFGNSIITNPDWSYFFAKGGASIGLKNFWLKGNADLPGVDTATGITYLTGTPDSGQVYRFTFDPPPFHTGISHTADEQEFTLYPNPSGGSFYITGRDMKNVTDVSIIDMQGRIVFEESMLQPGAQVHTGLPAGTYLLNINSDKIKTALPLVVQ